MRFVNKIVALFVAIAIAVMAVVPAYATVGDAVAYALTSWNEFVYRTFPAGQDETGNFWYLLAQPEDGECDHVWIYNADGYRYCSRCNMSFGEYYDSKYNNYISGLDRTTANTGIGVTGFSVSHISSSGSSSNYWSYPLEMQQCLKDAFYTNSAVVIGVYTKYMWGYYWTDEGILWSGVWENPLGSVTNASVLGVYPLSELTQLDDYNVATQLYFDRAHAEASSNFLISTVYAICWDVPFTSQQKASCYKKSSKDVTWTSLSDLQTVSIGIYTNLYNLWKPTYGNATTYYPSSSDVITWNSSHVVNQPTNTDSTTRTSSLMQTINNYNIDNSYTDNSTTVNYYIGQLGEDGSVTDVYSPAVYDEDTLVFTEPVTGAQYQTTGWTYDYTTRSYDITLDAGTYTIDGTDVTRIVSTYGDDLVTITYYDASGTVLATDEYAYVMASQSECNINGHTYTYEDVTAPTCTTPGQRKYTCSVCGNEYAEEISAIAHAYEYSVYQAASCTAAGIGLYTCSMCGNQYTEPIPPTGHTDKLIEYVPTEYDENGTAITVGYSIYECEVCGTQYTVSDEIPIEEESWFSWLFGLFKGLISSIVNGCSAAIEWFLGDVLGTVIDWFAQLAQWLFGQFDGSALSEWFGWFSDDNKILADEFGQDSSSSEVDVWAYSFD